ncbi:uncharacterized protein LOC131884830 [Tigriopus californicus]|uniref:uncharacterized protein LOC131884830 n=1 Tax=Tigriopus californicus TaxID=6832 RepID=UPI0027D9D77A|nr:uncharacterized protein LOC131884830 [Tigriopus californicus]
MSPFSHSNRRSISSSDDSKSSSAVLETFETGSPFQAKRETVPSKMDHSITTSSHHPPNLSESHMAAALSHYDHPNDLIQATMVDNNLARVQLAEAENFDAESEDDEGEEDDEDEKEEPGNVNEEAVERDSSRQANNGEAMKAAIVLGSVPGPSSNDRTTPNVIGPLESIEAGVEYGFVLDDEEIEEEARFLVVCIDGDVEDLVLLLEDMARAGETLTKEMLNYPDNSGRTPVSHLCGNGMIEMLELLEDIPNIEYNTPDSEGNTPLHFAAQAGHVEVVSFLLNKVRTIQVDPVNNLGFSPLMKASIQDESSVSKLLLFLCKLPF